MRLYLPMAILVTTLVTFLPAALVATLAPQGGTALTVGSGIAAVALSMAVATAAAALWKRQPRSRDILFADLLLWGWLRRCWTERRLARARELYESARRSGPMVSIELLAGLGRLMEARDAYTHGHGQRVARHAGRIARTMHLPPTEVAKIRTAAAVHDLGKLYTPRDVLNNPGRLSTAEFDVIKRHAADGAEMLADVGDREIVAMVRHHHERIDGRGYPDGLAGAEIPLGARIIAVADTFDAITSNRAYRGAGTQKQALEALASGSGTQLDGDAVAAFRHRYSDRRSVGWLALATAVAQRSVVAIQAASHSVGAGGAITSLLPALGAAGLLTLSPGLHRHVSRTPHRAAAVAAAHPHVLPASPLTHAVRQATTPARRSAPTGPAPHKQTIARIAPVRGTSGRPPTHRPNTTSSGRPSAAGRAPADGAAPPSPVSSPPPAPTVTSPQVEVVPPPVIPVTPTPVIPGVTLPQLPVPVVPLPHVTIPPVEAKVTVPGIG
jgi:putative nucleotidyltransferase with HDIG domain